ncbi:phage terminase small subunit P27 family [Sulfurimonas sp. NWX79]|uniref:phage terminase small subunit P27 family n=1 Tax=Sulfurimonas sp. NWX79 TaxID=2925412 RepID=UPI0032048380
MDLKQLKIDVESGAFSNVKLAKIHGCSESHIRNLTSRHGWNNPRKRNKHNSHDEVTPGMHGDLIDMVAVRKFEEIKREREGYLTKADETLLITLANQFARYIRLEKEVLKEGEVIISQKGAPYLNPKFNALQSAAKMLATLGKEFGLSIASRKRANIENKEVDDKESMFNIMEAIQDIDVDV